MQVNVSKGFQVVEYGLARQLAYLAGMGARRDTGDSFILYQNQGKSESFYVSAHFGDATSNTALATLVVDEGYWTNALHGKMGQKPITLAPIEETESCNSLRWCEYVDSTELFAALVRKLVPGAKIKPSDAMGAGRRQHDLMAQYKNLLLEWSKANPEHPLKFV